MWLSFSPELNKTVTTAGFGEDDSNLTKSQFLDHMKKPVVRKPPRKKFEAEESLVKTPQARGHVVNQENETTEVPGSKKTHVCTKQTTQTGKEEEKDSKRVGMLHFYDGRKINDDETHIALEMEQ